MMLFKRFGLLIGIVLLLVLSLQPITTAQVSSNVTARVSRLETENSTLRSRVNRLESDVARLSRASGVELSPPGQSSEPSSSAASSDPMFDRLATLAIELRDRIITLEEKVADLESATP
jgi:uncharacterized protein YceH (UPF0502 family)